MAISFKDFINSIKPIDGVYLPKSNITIRDAKKFIRTHALTTVNYMKLGNKKIANLFLDRLKEYKSETDK